MLGEAVQGPQRPADVAPFLLDVTEVTAGQFAGCIRAGACKDEVTVTRPYPLAGVVQKEEDFRRAGCTLHVAGEEHHPVTCVTWSQAQAFCSWAGGRLPSLAEWMLAAVGTEGRTYPWGEAAYDGSQANLAGAELREYEQRHRLTTYWAESRFRDDVLRSAPVASFPDGASPVGVYDLYGNAFEWLADAECAKPPCDELERATRGSSWVHGLLIPLQTPTSQPEAYGHEALGFRCAVSMSAQSAPLK
jgi:formylglycine-generating enzyme required for sulfatase activity